MVCSRCGSHNVKTFKMAHAPYDHGFNSWDALFRVLLLGPLGLLIKPRRSSVADMVAPPEKPFPVLAVVVVFVFFWTMAWLVDVYQRRGPSYPETRGALIVNAVLLVISLAVVSLDVALFVKAKREYPKRLDTWDHSWICLQCGTTYEIREQEA